MSEKVELTIHLPYLNLTDGKGNLWIPYESIFRGFGCQNCGKRPLQRGFRCADEFGFLCPDCVTLINPWEATND